MLLTDVLRAEKEEMWQRLMANGFRGSSCFVFLNRVSSEGADLLELGSEGVLPTGRGSTWRVLRQVKWQRLGPVWVLLQTSWHCHSDEPPAARPAARPHALFSEMEEEAVMKEANLSCM